VAPGALIDTGTLGAHSFSVTGTDFDGNSATLVHDYTVSAETSSALLEDSFDRPDSDLVGTGWAEAEATGASVSIAGQRLFFDHTPDLANRPLVRRSFSPVSSGSLHWDFDFDWARTGSEGTYAVLMQLGDGAQMSDDSPDHGVGVNLVWTRTDGVDQSLGFRHLGATDPLAVLSGPASVSVSADLDLHTFSLSIDGSPVQAGIPFDANVSLDTVRFLTNGLNEANFSGRSFDNVTVLGAN
jgi:hypothetical protein